MCPQSGGFAQASILDDTDTIGAIVVVVAGLFTAAKLSEIHHPQD
jgi:hypothetical protein